MSEDQLLSQYRNTVVTPLGTISYLDVGAGPATVFIHGVLTNSLLWRKIIVQAARDGRRCIALDLPGHGQTPVPVQDLDITLSGLADLVIGFVNALGVAGFDLVANDTGGAVAQIVAARAGDRIRTLTLTNCDTERHVPPTLFKPIVALSPPWLMARVGPRVFRRQGVLRALLRAGYRDPGALPAEIIESYGQPVFGTPESSRFLAKMLRAMHSRDLEDAKAGLAAFKVPTLIVWGTGDHFFPVKYAHRLGKLIAGTVAVYELNDARLYFPDEDAQQLLPLLQGHWSSGHQSSTA
ncbi:putative hydrolase, alpha/beta hydrolase fold protein [Mycobacteroides stephanolepidis]|uniref:Putative hydrolase, alpha/beta hydrolase fold protein n=1 Tax=[Mycobacterium] stephanolepidis TaxID=1520670 RepID=A0A1Z4EY05_9MYCO|nr:alpha/beta hydrolase [[Mycobacterium] stephanolepidis]BAX97812.1 putative hydrolase, alpha/beta hydrolase fold protein [[Mycobacterium] stephanolepidis]